jgi:translation initiation factor IF-2
VEKGLECGISLNGLRNGIELQEGDILECYKEKPAEPEKFDYTPGLRSSY